MALSTGEQVRYWSAGFAIFVAVLWFLGDTLLPFIIGAAIAYLLDPVADRLESWGLSRAWATVVITIAIFLLMILSFALILPLLVDQLRLLFTLTLDENGSSIFSDPPALIANAQSWLQAQFPTVFREDSPVWATLNSVVQTVQERGLSLLDSVLAGGRAVISFLVVLALSPVIAFYLLLDWDRMIGKIDSWLPRDHRETIEGLAGKVDRVLAGFIRGQLTVCAILGTFYAVGLSLIGLPFGLVIGLLAGLISFIPFIGAIFGGILALGVAVFQFWGDPVWIVVTAAIFMIGQALEGNILTPNLVGNSVGLHPVWLIFALSAFGAVFGFAGVLIAVPVAAVLGVLARFALEQYLQGRLYKGLKGKEDLE